MRSGCAANRNTHIGGRYQPGDRLPALALPWTGAAEQGKAQPATDAGEMFQRRDVIGQEFGDLVAAVERQDGVEHIEFLGLRADGHVVFLRVLYLGMRQNGEKISVVSPRETRYFSGLVMVRKVKPMRAADDRNFVVA